MKWTFWGQTRLKLSVFCLRNKKRLRATFPSVNHYLLSGGRQFEFGCWLFDCVTLPTETYAVIYAVTPANADRSEGFPSVGFPFFSFIFHFFIFLFTFYFFHSPPPSPLPRAPPKTSILGERRRRSNEEEEEEITRRQKQVPFHNRTHRNFLLFACVETPHSEECTVTVSRPRELFSYAVTGCELGGLILYAIAVFPLCVIFLGRRGHLNGPGHLFGRLSQTLHNILSQLTCPCSWCRSCWVLVSQKQITVCGRFRESASAPSLLTPRLRPRGPGLAFCSSCIHSLRTQFLSLRHLVLHAFSLCTIKNFWIS